MMSSVAVSLLDQLMSRELRSRSSLRRTDGGAEIEVDGVVKLLSFDVPNIREDIDVFSCWCVRPASFVESAVRSIKDRDHGSTLGYVFPVTSFSPGSDYSASRLDGRYAPIFAGAAALSIVERGIANAYLKANFDALPEEIPLRELFDPDLAVVVIGRQNMAVAGVVEHDVCLLVQEGGNFVADLPLEYAWRRPAPALIGGSFVLGRPSPDVSDVSELIGRLISLAASQASAVASLIVYYQVVEVLSERILAAKLRSLAAAPPSGAWVLKEALRDAVSEAGRVRVLCHQAQVGADVEAFLRLRDIGIEILVESQQVVKDDPSAAEVLYSVRNLVVHNQKSLNPEAHRLLGDFVSNLHASVFAMVRRIDLSHV
jgi:hypothetical protein